MFDSYVPLVSKACDREYNGIFSLGDLERLKLYDFFKGITNAVILSDDNSAYSYAYDYKSIFFQM